ncbi:MAG: type IV pilus biogenesis/stability protein PilW [Proteobacteria bacterium]|nr:type IV pilus biogenesis/stability protein PilW [Pseudomonadota bacterium]
MKKIIIPLLLLFLTACASTENDPASIKKRKLIDTQVQLAVGYMRRGQLDYAKQNVDKALALDNTNTNANHVAALLMIRLKRFADAEMHFKRSIEKDANNSGAQNNYGVYLCDQGRYLEAVNRFDAAIDNPLYKTPFAAAENAGLCLSKAKKYRSAEKYFRMALKYYSKSAKALLGLARISYKRGRMLSARAFLQRYFGASQDTPEALLLAIKVERALGSRDQLATYKLRLRGKFPDSKEAQAIN